MEWVIGLIILMLIFGSSKEGRCSKRRRYHPDRPSESAEMSRMKADMERMRERMNTMERIITDDEARLRREFRNL